jgi:hypothetical protein
VAVGRFAAGVATPPPALPSTARPPGGIHDFDQAVPELLRVFERQARPLEVDLSELLTADADGLEVLRRQYAAGAMLVGVSPYVRLLLGDPPGGTRGPIVERATRDLQPGDDRSATMVAAEAKRTIKHDVREEAVRADSKVESRSDERRRR